MLFFFLTMLKFRFWGERGGVEFGSVFCCSLGLYFLGLVRFGIKDSEESVIGFGRRIK